MSVYRTIGPLVILSSLISLEFNDVRGIKRIGLTNLRIKSNSAYALDLQGSIIVAEAVLTSTHNLCFGAKIRKIGIPLHTPVLQYKEGVFIAQMCFPGDVHVHSIEI